MQFTTLFTAATLVLAASAAPALEVRTDTDCSAYGSKNVAVCCNFVGLGILGCLLNFCNGGILPILSDNAESYCCDTNANNQVGIINVNALNCVNVL